MTIPATPMNEAALRYSPEIAEAFQPTLTLRPATKKSCAVFDFRAAQKPMKIVAKTVRALKARMYGSIVINPKTEGRNPREIRKPKAETPRCLSHSNFEPRHPLGFRERSFGI